jgi:hypothetical protein
MRARVLRSSRGLSLYPEFVDTGQQYVHIGYSANILVDRWHSRRSQALNLTDRGNIDFVDDNNSIFEPSIEMLATARTTKGCNPPVNDMFCPTSSVTREQMAGFLHRALG